MGTWGDNDLKFSVCVSEGTSPKSGAWVHGVTMILSAVCVCDRGHKPQVWNMGTWGDNDLKCSVCVCV